MKFSFYFLILLFLGGCATVVRLPSSTRQLPMTNGTLWGGNVGLNVVSAIPVTVVNDNRTTPPTRDSIKVGSDGNLTEELFPILTMLSGSGIDFSLGIAENFDLYLSGAFGLRYQYLGGKELGWVATAFFGAYDSTSLFTDNSVDTTVTLRGLEFGTSIGKHFEEMQTFYFTIASRGGAAGIELKQTSGTKYKYNDSFDHYILSAGYMYGKTWVFRTEASGTFVTWRGRSDNLNREITGTGSRLGITLGLSYNW